MKEPNKSDYEKFVWVKLQKDEAVKPKPTVVVKRKTGFINIHIDIKNEQVMVSTKPYPTREDADKGIHMGFGIEKIGCFEIEYTAYPISRIVGSTIEYNGDTF